MITNDWSDCLVYNLEKSRTYFKFNSMMDYGGNLTRSNIYANKRKHCKRNEKPDEWMNKTYD